MKAPRINRSVIILASLSCFTLAGGGCGKKKSSTAAPDATDTSATTATSVTPGVTEATGTTLTLSGELTADPTSLTGGMELTAAARKILYFTILGGEIMSAPTNIDPDENGLFTASISSINTTVRAAKVAIAQKPIDKAPLEAAFPAYAKDIAKMSDADIKANLSSMLAELDARGGPQYVLASYVPSGDLVAEAQSFRFIGMPSTGKNVMVFPGDSLKGNLAFGAITGTTEDSSTELKADTSVLNLDEKGIAQLASMGQMLKVVRNYWINKTADGSSVKFEAEPFFAWQGKLSVLTTTTLSTPASLTYNGYGMYIKANGFTGASFAELCPAGGTNDSPATPTKILALTPPSAVVREMFNPDGSVMIKQTFNATNPMDNGEVIRLSQNGQSVCNGNKSGFYARDDSSRANAGDMMLNWGTGGSLQGKVPKGLWNLKLAGSSIAQFDLAAGFPLDGDGNPKVLVPVVKLTESGSNVTAITVNFMVYRPETKTFEAVTDLALFNKMAGSLTVGVSVGNGNGSDEHSGSVGGDASGGVTVKQSGATLTGTLAAQYQLPRGTSYGETGTITSVYVGYQLGSSSYRFSWSSSN